MTFTISFTIARIFKKKNNMSFIIDNEQCIDCRLCIAECPDGGISISFNEEEIGNKNNEK
jgi:NAD-dependent dihydropyrimidine dehydrogenase PreA subunit